MYKKTTITQLGTCTVDVEHKNKKAYGHKAQPLKDFILGSSPSAGI